MTDDFEHIGDLMVAKLIEKQPNERRYGCQSNI